MTTAVATARSGQVDEAATQTEPPKVDAAIQAELSAPVETASTPPASARPATNRQRREVAGSRPASTAKRPATRDGLSVATTPQSRPATQSRGKPATATAGSPGQRRSSQPRPSHLTQPPTLAASIPGDITGGGQPGVLFVDNNRAWQQFQESSSGQRQHGAECTPMVYSYNPDPRLRAWQSLEHARLHNLGLSSKLSRRYNVQRSSQFVPVGLHMRSLQGPAVRAAFLPPLAEEFNDSAGKKNDVAPFLTFQKPTCGYFFSRETDNRKIKHGLAPADLPMWGIDLLDRQ